MKKSYKSIINRWRKVKNTNKEIKILKNSIINESIRNYQQNLEFEKLKKLNSREQELFKLGFKKNNDQGCFILFKFNCHFYVDFYKITDYQNPSWKILIENIRYDLKEAEIKFKQSDLYILGRNSAQKEIKQKLLNKLNHYKSNLQEETKVKLNRLANKEKIRELEIRIETIKDLMK